MFFTMKQGSCSFVVMMNVRPVDAYPFLTTKLSVVQAMGFHPYGAEPLPEPMMYNSQINPEEQIIMKFESMSAILFTP